MKNSAERVGWPWFILHGDHLTVKNPEKDVPYIKELLKQQIALKQVKVDFNTTVELITKYVKDLNSIVYQIKTEELIAEVVDKLDFLFSIRLNHFPVIWS